MTNLNFITSPLDQFEIRDLISLDAPLLGNLHISITNIALYLFTAFTIIVLLTIMTNNNRKLVYNN
jgi:F-type H+-transporting ATPase subunit a